MYRIIERDSRGKVARISGGFANLDTAIRYARYGANVKRSNLNAGSTSFRGESLDVVKDGERGKSLHRITIE